MPFYGNITNRRNQFTYDKVYPNKKTLLDTVSSANAEKIGYNEIIIDKQDDGVFIGRYVLIDYGFNSSINNDDNDFLTQHQKNYQIDNQDVNANQQRSWDSTVWQKVYLDGTLTYVLIAELNAKQAQLELYNYPPSYRNEEGQKQFLEYNQIDGEENSFVIKAQDNYQIDINVPLKTGGTLTFPQPDNVDLTQIDLINAAGFDASKRSYVNTNGPVAAIIESSSGQKYLTNNFYGTANDILTFQLDLREIGNFASNFYDILYSQNRDIIIDINNFNTIPEEPKTNCLYRVGVDYRCLVLNNETNNYYWEPVFNLSKKVEEDGSNSLFELMLNLKRLEGIIENNSATVSDSQMNIILSYFDNVEFPETHQQLGEIMELKYLGYVKAQGTAPAYHQMQFSQTFDRTDGIFTGVVKFGADFTYGDKIVLYKLPLDGGEDTSNPFVSSSTGEPIYFTVIMTNGTEATTGAWSTNTVGLVNFGLEEDKAYIYSAVPIWA